MPEDSTAPEVSADVISVVHRARQDSDLRDYSPNKRRRHPVSGIADGPIRVTVSFTFKSRHQGSRWCSVHPVLCEPVGDHGIDRFRGSDVGITSGLIAFLLLGKAPTV